MYILHFLRVLTPSEAPPLPVPARSLSPPKKLVHQAGEAPNAHYVFLSKRPELPIMAAGLLESSLFPMGQLYISRLRSLAVFYSI